MGLQILKKDGWVEGAIGGASRIEVQVREPATAHVVTLTQIERWLTGATISPKERVRKDRLRALLAAK